MPRPEEPPGPPARGALALLVKVTLALAAGALLASSCTREERPELPAACRSGDGAVEAALADAPKGRGAIGETPLSSCLARSSEPGEIQEVGAAFLAVAARLAPRARSQPESAAAARLGYLMGAARRGAARTQGIHGEMVRRLEQEMGLLERRSAAFRRGERAGRASG